MSCRLRALACIASFSLASGLPLAAQRAVPSSSAAHAQINLGTLGDLARGRSVGSGVSAEQASGGLREALTRGIDTSVTSTGRPGGYFDNPLIKILLPPRFDRLAQTMRALGMGAQVDSFIRSMNAAAEQAAPAARTILLDALKQMTFSDAKGIVTGGKTSATDYFRRTSTAEIEEAFRPIVEEAMSKAGVNQQFQALTSKAPVLPFVKAPTLDVNQYVLDKSTEGLFTVMAQEETRIRTDPAAQVTPLLRAVFGGR